MHPTRRRKKRPSYGVRTVEVQRGANGFGFTISGQAPCLLSCIVSASPADAAGLRPGDYLLAVNGQNVAASLHDDVVQLIGSTHSTLRLQIAENYYTDSSEDEACVASRNKHKPAHRARHRHGAPRAGPADSWDDEEPARRGGSCGGGGRRRPAGDHRTGGERPHLPDPAGAAARAAAGGRPGAVPRRRRLPGHHRDAQGEGPGRLATAGHPQLHPPTAGGEEGAHAGADVGVPQPRVALQHARLGAGHLPGRPDHVLRHLRRRQALLRSGDCAPARRPQRPESG